MRYTYNEVGLLTNGVIFYFESGDIEIARDSIRTILFSRQVPATLILRDRHLSPAQALSELNLPNALSRGYLGIRFIVDETQLLGLYLNSLNKYPALSMLTQEIRAKVFGTSEVLQ